MKQKVQAKGDNKSYDLWDEKSSVIASEALFAIAFRILYL